MVFLGLAVVTVLTGFFSTVRFFQTKIVSAPDIGGSYIEGVLEEPRFINPVLASNETEQSITNLVFQGLLRLNANGALMPDAAEKYSLSSDEKQYTIHLKRTNMWHDGTALTADDVLFTIAMIQNPDYRSPLRPNWQGVTAEKIDDWTIIITLRQAYAPFIQNLAVGILPKHLWSDIKPEHSAQTELNTKPVGSGFYQFKKFTRSTAGSILSYTLERNTAADANTPPYIKTLTFQVFTSEETMISNYQRGKIQGMSFISAENADKIAKNNGIVYTLKLPQIFALFLNQTKNKSLADAAVREALDRSINRSLLIEKIFRKGASEIGSPFPPETNATTTPAVKEDIDRAKKLLEKAGWKINPDTGIRERTLQKPQKNGPKTETLHISITTSAWPDLVAVAGFIKDEWLALGIDASVEVTSVPQLEHDSIRPRNYDALLFGEGFGHDFDPFSFWHSSQIKHPGLNLSLYVNKKVDSLLEAARQIKNKNEVLKKYKDIEELIIKDRPALFLYTPTYFFVMTDAVHGVITNNITKPSDRFYTAQDWFIDTDWKLKKN